MVVLGAKMSDHQEIFENRRKNDPQGVIDDLIKQTAKQAKYITELMNKIDKIEKVMNKIDKMDKKTEKKAKKEVLP